MVVVYAPLHDNPSIVEVKQHLNPLHRRDFSLPRRGRMEPKRFRHSPSPASRWANRNRARRGESITFNLSKLLTHRIRRSLARIRFPIAELAKSKQGRKAALVTSL